jgi:hypothetical protein
MCMIDDQVKRIIVLQLHTQAHYYHMSQVVLKIRAQAQAQIWEHTRCAAWGQIYVGTRDWLYEHG